MRDSHSWVELTSVFGRSPRAFLPACLPASCFLLQVETAIEASPLSTAKLDLVCAYLKRVHFFIYYRGQQCKDEGDMIAARGACRAVEAASKEEVGQVSI